MIQYILDTDILTLFQNGHPNVVQRARAVSQSQLAVSVISVEEELTGWYAKLRRAKKKDQLARAYRRLTDAVQFFSRLDVLTFTEQAIERYEYLRSTLRRMSKNDLRIASIVLEHDVVLVTRNIRDFQQVPGLKTEDWSQ